MDSRLNQDSTQVTQPASLQPGGFWRRFVAMLLDSLILAVIQTPLSFLFGFLGGSTVGTDTYWIVLAVSYTIGVGATVLYCGWFYQNKGATPGKMVMGLKVIDANTGTHISYGRAFLREVVGKLLSAVLFMVGYLMAGFRGDKKALHDLIANTQVLRTK